MVVIDMTLAFSLNIDKKALYHSLASFKDLDKKCFAITKIESKELLDSLLEKLK